MANFETREIARQIAEDLYGNLTGSDAKDVPYAVHKEYLQEGGSAMLDFLIDRGVVLDLDSVRQALVAHPQELSSL